MKKKKASEYFQRLSSAFLMPIAVLCVASLLMGIASIFLWHETLREMFPILTHPVVQYIANLMNTMGGTITNNLPIIYCVSIGYAMANEEKGVAAFGALVGYLAFITGMALVLTVNPAIQDGLPTGAAGTVLGQETVNTGILGGIVVGLISAELHNRFYQVKLPMAISFFGGVRFVPIATLIFFVLFGQVVPFIWAPISQGINFLAKGVAGAGIFGPFLYELGERLLIPTGMHQIWNTVIRDTAVSGSFVFPEPYGRVEGARAIWNAFMATGKIPKGTNLAEMAKFLRGGQIPHMVFAMPAVAYAMYRCADDDKKKLVKPLLFTGACTAIIAGISEPLEFAFLFASPPLYLIYSVFCGLAQMIPYIFKSTLGGTEGSIVGLIIFGFLRSDATWWINVIVGIVLAIVMYITFRWFIIRFDVKTPGRGGDYDKQMKYAGASGTEKELNVSDPEKLKAQLIIRGLGGAANILDVQNCMTRLRVEMKDGSLVDEALLKDTGCLGIVKGDDTHIQIVYGTSVVMIKNAVSHELKKINQR